MRWVTSTCGPGHAINLPIGILGSQPLANHPAIPPIVVQYSILAFEGLLSLLQMRNQIVSKFRPILGMNPAQPFDGAGANFITSLIAKA